MSSRAKYGVIEFDKSLDTCSSECEIRIEYAFSLESKMHVHYDQCVI